MVKFIFFSFIFHLTLLVVFKLKIIDQKKNKEQAVNVNLTVENKNVIEKQKPKKEIKPKKTIKEKEKPQNSNEEKFDDLLKNLAKEKLPLDSQNNFEEKLKELSEQKLKDNNRVNKKIPNKNELSAIEKLILTQIDENWSRPPGIKTSKNLIIKVIVGLDINGNVINLQIHNNTLKEIAKDNKLQPYLDSAIRAIKKASPFEGLKLPAIIFSSVDLPAPLSPINPTVSASLISKLTPVKACMAPKFFSILFKERMLILEFYIYNFATFK